MKNDISVQLFQVEFRPLTNGKLKFGHEIQELKMNWSKAVNDTMTVQVSNETSEAEFIKELAGHGNARLNLQPL
jgi:hypothetical protein